jgi:hypothetical protein
MVAIVVAMTKTCSIQYILITLFVVSTIYDYLVY